MRASLNQAMDMAKKLGYVFLTTSDNCGRPHLSIVQALDIDSRERLSLMAWFCQNTFKNLQENPNVSVVVWDPIHDDGYQLSGVMDDMEEVAILDGYSFGLEERKHFPQVEWRIRVSVEKILNFQKAPHIDVEV